MTFTTTVVPCRTISRNHIKANKCYYQIITFTGFYMITTDSPNGVSLQLWHTCFSPDRKRHWACLWQLLMAFFTPSQMSDSTPSLSCSIYLCYSNMHIRRSVVDPSSLSHIASSLLLCIQLCLHWLRGHASRSYIGSMHSVGDHLFS